MNKLKTNEELDIELGKANKWFPKILSNHLEYVSGIEDFDEIISTLEIPPIFNLVVRPKGLVITLNRMKGLKFITSNFGILLENISSIVLEDKEQIYLKKEKSIVGRAIVGTLIFGPFGGIIGGMTGIGEKEYKATMPDLIFCITHLHENKECNILFKCNYHSKYMIVEFMKEHYKTKFLIE